MSQGKNCREAIFVSQLSRNYPHRGGDLERGKKPPLVGVRDGLGGILGDNLGEGNCESKIVLRERGDNFCREASRCLAGPSGQWKFISVMRFSANTSTNLSLQWKLVLLCLYCFFETTEGRKSGGKRGVL